MAGESSEGHFTTKQLADMAGISARTLRYYDQIGLLVPEREENGYRSYGPSEVRRLQHILLLRSCGVPLQTVEEALDQADFSLSAMLTEHLSTLQKQRSDLEKTIATVRRVVAGLGGFEEMDDNQRFEEIKKQSIEQFEEEYGEEARKLYGDEAIDASNERMLSMSKPAWDAKEELEQRIKDNLAVAMATGDPSSPESRMVAGMHQQWIKVHWGEDAYTPEAHVSLAEGYLADPRFVEYYDSAAGEGATEFLRDIIVANIGNEGE